MNVPGVDRIELPRIFVALDPPDEVLEAGSALGICGWADDMCQRFEGLPEVGVKLAHETGYLRRPPDGHKIFYDAKFSEVGFKLVQYARGLAAKPCPPAIVTLAHRLPVEDMQAFKRLLPHTTVAAVSVPTSFSEATCRTVFDCGIREEVLRRANEAVEAGLDALVLSPIEARWLRQEHADKIRTLMLICPGVYTEQMNHGQNPARTASVAEASRDADVLVVGRSITRSANPREAAEVVMSQIRPLIA